MHLVLKGQAYFYHYNFGQNACYLLRVSAGGKGSMLREVWSRHQQPPGVVRRAQRASSQTANRNPKASHSANTPHAARLMASFHGTKLARAWSVRVGKLEGASLEVDMVYGERVRAWHV